MSRVPCFTLVILAVINTACEQRMEDQPRLEALEAAEGFPHRQSALHPPDNTVSRSESVLGGLPPESITVADIRRGQERYRIYCVPCHGELGDGSGPVVSRGYPRPPSFYDQRLRQASLRHLYRVTGEGYGAMYGYADRLSPGDRWRVALYVRALQVSQKGNVIDYPRYTPHSEPRPRDLE